jgi:phage shock protein C
MTGDHRIWRVDRGAMLSGVCAGLAEDLDLPVPLVRAVSVIFLVLPTGLAYLALSMLLRRRPMRVRSRLGGTSSGAARFIQPEGPARKQSWALLAHRFEALEPRLKRIEAFVTSNEFELHRGFQRMGE